MRSPSSGSAKDWMEYGLARALGAGLTGLPENTAHWLGSRVGSLAFSALRVRRDVVEANLRIAYPGAPSEWLRRIAEASYSHHGREAVAMLRLAGLDRQAVVERTVTHGWDEFQLALSAGRGVILATGHYGNWEIAAATVAARGVPIGAIVRRQRNRLFDEHLNALRARLGIETIYQTDAPRKVPRLLRRNGVVGIVSDQHAGRAGVAVGFFGRPVSAHRGPALFALKYGAAVFSCVARRRAGPGVTYDVMGDLVTTERTGNLDADVQGLTAELYARLEAHIRVAPEQYFWFHRRWRAPADAVVHPVEGPGVPA